MSDRHPAHPHEEDPEQHIGEPVPDPLADVILPVEQASLEAQTREQEDG